jgi:thiol:disulfide interchange protein DsbA
MKKLVLGGLSAAVMAFSMNAMAADFVAGKDYTVVANPKSGSTGENRST